MTGSAWEMRTRCGKVESVDAVLNICELSRLRKAREWQRDDSARAVGFIDDDAVALSGEERDQGRFVVLLVFGVVMQVCEEKIRRPLLLVVAVLRLPSPS